MAGVNVTFISEGPRKVEPLTEEANTALAENVRNYYDMFTKEVAKSRDVSTAIVRADSEKSEKHFGGVRMNPAQNRQPSARDVPDRTVGPGLGGGRLARADGGASG